MNNYVLYVFYLLIFLVNPFCGTLLIWGFYLLESRKRSYTFLAFLMSVMVTLINLTKLPENDLFYHSQEYLIAGRLDYFAYLAYKTKEPFFYSFNYVCYYLTNGSVKIWLFSISFVSYMFFLMAIIKILTKVKATKSQILLGMISAVFFPQLFSLSAHLVRQFIAGSMFVYFVVDFIYDKNKKWWLGVLGFLIHASSVILFPLAFFRKLGDFKKHFNINMFLLIMLLSYQLVAMVLLKLLGSGGFVGYILKRGSVDTSFDLGDFNWINYILMLFICYGAIKYSSRAKKYKPENRHFISIIFVLSMFILVNIHQSELSARMFFYLFFFFPIVLALLCSSNFKGYKELNFLISCFFIIFFMYRLRNGTWTYASLGTLMKFDVLDYLLYEPTRVVR